MIRTKALVIVLMVATTSGAVTASTLEFNHARQEHSNWCWLAASQNLLSFHGTTKSQCELANLAFNRTDACGNGNFNWNHPANKPGALYGYPTGVDKFLSGLAGRRPTGYQGSMGWNGIKTNIDRKLPIVALWEWKETDVAHLLTIYGYTEERGEQFVSYSDPYPTEGKKYAKYEWFKASDEGRRGSHRWTFSLEVE